MADMTKNNKFSILFNWFDQSRDGYLTQDDFQQFAGLFLALPGGKDPENERALRAAFGKWWELLLAVGDTSGDGKVGREEFVTAMKANVTTPGNFDAAIGGIVDAFMRIVDTDKNGSLSFNEYVQMYASLGIDPTHSSAAFKRLDLDGDNTLSYEEFRKAIADFYLSDDLNAPGNWLLGPLS